MSDESPLDRFKSVLTGASRAIAREPELEVAWTADNPVVTGNTLRVPSPGRVLHKAQVDEARGFADSFALRRRLHDEAQLFGCVGDRRLKGLALRPMRVKIVASLSRAPWVR